MATNETKHTKARIGLKQIAERAGVSVGSVSSVINNRGTERRIPQKTADSIRKAASELGYLPNVSARRLRSSSAQKNPVVIALITSFEAPIPLSHHFLRSLREATQQASVENQNYHYSLTIEMFTAGKLHEIPSILTGDHFNAALILNTVPQDDMYLKRSKLPYPVVLVNRSIPGYTCILEEDVCGIRPAEVFAEMARKQPAILYGLPLTQSTDKRVDFYMQTCLEKFGQRPFEIISDSLSEMEGYRAVSSFLKAGQKADCIYAVSDALAIGAYRAIQEAGLSIPEDIAVIGVGDYNIAPFMHPPLSCMGVSHEQLARLASESLMKSLFAYGSSPEVHHATTIESLRQSTNHCKLS